MFIAKIREESGDEFFITFKAENEGIFDEEALKENWEILDKVFISGILKEFVVYNYADINYHYNFVVVEDFIENKKEYIVILSDEKLKILVNFIDNTGFKIKNINPISDKVYDHIINLEKNTDKNTVKGNLDIILEKSYARKNRDVTELEDIIKTLIKNYQSKTNISNEELTRIIDDVTNLK